MKEVNNIKQSSERRRLADLDIVINFKIVTSDETVKDQAAGSVGAAGDDANMVRLLT